MNNKTVLNLPVKEDDLVLLNKEIIDSKNPYHIADKKTPKVPKAKIPSAMIPMIPSARDLACPVALS